MSTTKTLMEQMQAEAGLTEMENRPSEHDPGHFAKIATGAYGVESAVMIAENHLKKIRTIATALKNTRKNVQGYGSGAMDATADLILAASGLLTQAELMMDEVKTGHVGAAYRMAQKTLRRLEPIR